MKFIRRVTFCMDAHFGILVLFIKDYKGHPLIFPDVKVQVRQQRRKKENAISVHSAAAVIFAAADVAYSYRSQNGIVRVS